MMRKVLNCRFATAAPDYLSTKGLKMFGSGDYPEALKYSRPFRNSTATQISPKPPMESPWPPKPWSPT